MVEPREGHRNQSRADFDSMLLSKRDSEYHNSLQLGVPNREPWAQHSAAFRNHSFCSICYKLFLMLSQLYLDAHSATDNTVAGLSSVERSTALASDESSR